VATNSLPVTADGDDVIAWIELAIVALTLIWVIALVLPLALPKLTPKEQETINEYLVTVPLAVTIHLAVLARLKRNRRS
jgi:hypothetical protein